MKSKILTADNLLAFLFIATVFLLAFNKIQDTDAWMHLSLGRAIWELKGLPKNELFVYPNFNQPFSYTSWLFAVLFYVAYLVKGAAGMALLQATIVTTAFSFLWFDSLRPQKYCSLAAIVLSLVVLVAMHRFVTRPDIFLMMFLAMTVYILNALLYDNKKKGLYLLPIIVLAWANIHTSVNLIVVPVGAFIVGSYLQQYVNRKGMSNAPFLSGSQVRLLLMVFCIALFLSLLNPNGIMQYLAGVRFIGADFYKQEIEELLPPTGAFKTIVIAIDGIVALSFLLNRKNISIPHLLLVAPFLLLPFLAIRFVPIAVIVEGPIVVRNISCFCSRRKSIQNLVQGRTATVAIAVVIAVFGALYVKDKRPPFEVIGSSISFGAGFDDSAMPVGAVTFMDRQGIYGRVFNTYADGQYIIWTGYPKRQVYIDARGGLPGKLLEMGALYRHNNQVVDELFGKYHFDSMLIPAGDIVTNDSSLQKIDMAFSHPEWALVYWDNKSLVYLRRHGKYDGVINKFEYKYFNADTTIHIFAEKIKNNINNNNIENELIRNISETGSTKGKFFLGLMYYNQKKYDRAIPILEDALSVAGGNFYKDNSYAILGDIYYATGNFDKCLYYYGKTPGNEKVPVIQYNMGKIMYAKGRAKEAIKHFEQALAVDKNAVQVYSDLLVAYRANGEERKAAEVQQSYNDLMGQQTAKMYFERGAIAQQRNDLDSAIDDYKRSLEANPSSPVVWTNLGFIYFDKKQVDQAYECFTKAVTLQKDYANAHYGLAVVYKEKNVVDKAREHFLRYSELEPSGFFSREAKEQVQALGRP